MPEQSEQIACLSKTCTTPQFSGRQPTLIRLMTTNCGGAAPEL